MATEQKSRRFIDEAPSFAICTVCDKHYSAGTLACETCKSPLSIVRKCPNCERIVSAKHERCVYCSASFLQEENDYVVAAAPEPAVSLAARHDPVQKRRAILVSVAVFLAVMFLGLCGTMRKIGKSGPEVAASSYLLRAAPLRLQPNASAGTLRNIDAGTVVSLTGMAVDPEGHRWYVLRDGTRDVFLKITDVAPPKARLLELGSQMLRAWLMALRDPELVPEADSAVAYYCAQFRGSAQCNELRFIAAEQFRSIAQRTDSQDALTHARQLYQAIIDAKTPSSADAAKAMERLGNGNSERISKRSSHSRNENSAKNAGDASVGEYALVDHAEVHVRMPDLKTVGTSGQVRVPIAREIRINGKTAVPSNATCVLKVSESASTQQPIVQLMALEFGNRRYSVSTSPQPVPTGGSVITFHLDSSLLISK